MDSVVVANPVVIGVYGGSFNPVHVAHQMTVLWALEAGGCDSVWVIPTFAHAFGKALAPYEQRLDMCKLAFERFGDRVTVSALERDLAEQHGVNRTLDTLKAVEYHRPHARLRLLVGADILAETDKWHRWDAVCALAKPLVLRRPGSVVSPTDLEAYDVSGVALPAVSGTEVRRCLAAQESVRGLVPTRVIDYIEQTRLYG